MKLALLGQGRLGSTVEVLLRKSHFTICAWRRGETMPSADVYWVLVPDHAISDVARQIPHGAVVLHASGALNADPLHMHDDRGTLHPAASFPGANIRTPQLEGVRAVITGTPRARAAAHKIATALGMTPIAFEGDLRLYHAACVIAGNFSTTLLHEAIKVATQAGLSLEDATAITGQLASTTLQNARELGPENALTGPFARGDLDIVRGHREAIGQNLPDVLPFYDQLAEATTQLAGKSGLQIEEIVSLIRTDRQRSKSDGEN